MLGIVYQPSTQIEEKMKWLNKINIMLSLITLTFAGAFLLAGNTNLNVNKPPRFQKQYQEILENFNHAQHMNSLLRKGTH